eukprot:357220-Chlamydomonas_euryale.AAC.2
MIRCMGLRKQACALPRRVKGKHGLGLPGRARGRGERGRLVWTCLGVRETNLISSRCAAKARISDRCTA